MTDTMTFQNTDLSPWDILFTESSRYESQPGYLLSGFRVLSLLTLSRQILEHYLGYVMTTSFQKFFVINYSLVILPFGAAYSLNTDGVIK
jgi:hypothetical protein